MGVMAAAGQTVLLDETVLAHDPGTNTFQTITIATTATVGMATVVTLVVTTTVRLVDGAARGDTMVGEAAAEAEAVEGTAIRSSFRA